MIRRAMSHRFKMPPGGSALHCWLNPQNCARIKAQIEESQRAISAYVRMRDAQRQNPEFGPTPAKGGFPYYGNF
jgi:hypothetical protein